MSKFNAHPSNWWHDMTHGAHNSMMLVTHPCPLPEMKMLTLLSLDTESESWRENWWIWWLGTFYSWPGEVRPILAGGGRSAEMTWEPDIPRASHFAQTACLVRSLSIEVSFSISNLWSTLQALIPSPGLSPQDSNLKWEDHFRTQGC